MNKAMIYNGPDQRKEKRAIVLGMACPSCKGPVHDPAISRDDYKARDGDPYQHKTFQCLDDKCGWESYLAVMRRARYDR